MFKNAVCFRTLHIRDTVLLENQSLYLPNSDLTNPNVLKELMCRVFYNYLTQSEDINDFNVM